MKITCLSAILLLNLAQMKAQKVFDTHIHGNRDIKMQTSKLRKAGVYKAAVSTSWAAQENYKNNDSIQILKGLMLPCPNGKVPYSLQKCYESGQDFPDPGWVEQQIRENRIHFIGEVLSQYYGIAPSDKTLYPYYALAQKYGLPVGIHSGLAGPNHGSPHFKVSLGNPMLLEPMLRDFPNLKVWIMHAGAPFMDDTIAIMTYYRNVYADLSAVSDPDLFPTEDFRYIMKRLINAGLGDRLMFGSDNGDIEKCLASIKALDFLSQEQKDAVLYKNAERFFQNPGQNKR